MLPRKKPLWARERVSVTRARERKEADPREDFRIASVEREVPNRGALGSAGPSRIFVSVPRLRFLEERT